MVPISPPRSPSPAALFVIIVLAFLLNASFVLKVSFFLHAAFCSSGSLFHGAFEGRNALLDFVNFVISVVVEDEELVAAAAWRYSIFNKICKFIPHSVVLLLPDPMFSHIPASFGRRPGPGPDSLCTQKNLIWKVSDKISFI